jgi:hypothetical protein
MKTISPSLEQIHNPKPVNDLGPTMPNRDAPNVPLADSFTEIGIALTRVSNSSVACGNHVICKWPV